MIKLKLLGGTGVVSCDGDCNECPIGRKNIEVNNRPGGDYNSERAMKALGVEYPNKNESACVAIGRHYGFIDLGATAKEEYIRKFNQRLEEDTK